MTPPSRLKRFTPVQHSTVHQRYLMPSLLRCQPNNTQNFWIIPYLALLLSYHPTTAQAFKTLHLPPLWSNPQRGCPSLKQWSTSQIVICQRLSPPPLMTDHDFETWKQPKPFEPYNRTLNALEKIFKKKNAHSWSVGVQSGKCNAIHAYVRTYIHKLHTCINLPHYTCWVRKVT